MAELNIDIDAVPPREGGDFDPIPDCEVVAHIIETVVTEKEGGAKQRCVFTWEILDGPYAKRRIWDGQNIRHPNAQTQEIASRAVKDIATAVGHSGVVRESAVLEFKPVLIRVRTEPAQNGYAAKNAVKGYKPVNGAAAAPAAATAPAAAAKPWGQKAA